MMKNIIAVLSLVLVYYGPSLFAQAGQARKTKGSQEGKIVIEVCLKLQNITDSLNFEYSPVEFVGFDRKSEGIKKKLVKGNAKCILFVNEPYYVSPHIFKKQNIYWLAEPGDSVVITYDGKKLAFSGNGSGKFSIQYKVAIEQHSIVKPSNPYSYTTKSLDDYWEWDRYLNKQLELLLPLIDSCKSSLSSFAYQHIRSSIIDKIEDDRHEKFSGLRAISQKYGINNKRLCEIFDSTFFGKPATWLRSLSIGVGGRGGFIKDLVYRRYNFDASNIDTLESRSKRNMLYYELGKEIYKGLTREIFLVGLLAYDVIKKAGFTPETELMLADYYAEPGYQRYKEWLKNYEKETRVLRAGYPAPEFSLSDVEGMPFSKSRLKGKIVLMDFWFTGCLGCVQMATALQKVEEAFRNDTNVIFLSISTDKNRSMWLKSIEQKKYTTGSGANLYTGIEGDSHPMLKAYNITSYPNLYLLNEDGRIFINPVPDPRIDNGEQLIKLIRQQLVLFHDGPYVMEEDGFLNAYYIYGNVVAAKALDKEAAPVVTIQSDEFGETFDVRLKSKLTIEPSEFAKPPKLFILSDIEGSFDAFRKLLQFNKIIDDKYNWTFGDGHLILNGDIFDRGKQVTECLWLIYSLEEKAKVAGGYVHYILGNHEIMNLNGNESYVPEKYKGNAHILNKKYTELYGGNTELGKWLRTKNIMEKIGDLLFMHGGVSKELNDFPISIREINEVARPYYDKDTLAKKSEDKVLSLLFDQKLSPFWYRLYYLDQEMKIMYSSKRGIDTMYKTPMKEIDNTLTKFGVKRIITGHTIIDPGDKVTAHYDGKVINTDTKHAFKKSEALLIIDDEYYRVNSETERFLLFEGRHIYTRK